MSCPFGANETMSKAPDINPLAVPAATLKALGWTCLRAERSSQPDVLIPLLTELRNETCVHTWRRHLPTSGPVTGTHCQTLLETENSLRPTEVFAYIATLPDGQEVIAAAGTVSDRIRGDFPFEGFPVAARCYIRQAFRKHGLYRHILGHRLDHCVRRWGHALKAVHLGSANPKVWEAVALHGGFALSFVHVGDEDLEVRGQVHRVPALMAFHPSFRSSVVAASQENGFDGEFRRTLEDVIEGRTDGSAWGRLRTLAEQQHSQSAGAYPTELRELFALGDAIPLKR